MEHATAQLHPPFIHLPPGPVFVGSMSSDMHDTVDEPRLQEEEPTSREPLQNKMNGSDAIQSSKEVNNEDGGDDPKEDTTLLRSSLQSDGSKQRSSKKIQWTPQILVEEEEKQQDLDAGMNNGDIDNDNDYNVQKSVEFSTEFSNINEKDYSNERKAEAALKDRQRRKRIIERKAKLERVQERKRRESESQFNYSRSNFPIREWKFMLPFGIQHPVVINPLVTGMAVTSLWGLVIWGGASPDYSLSTLVAWRTWISLHFTWFFQGSTGLLFFFMMYIVWRFGHVRLGLPGTEHEPPEFSTGAYICLIFTGGIGAGFFAFAVSQVLWSQTGHFYAATGYRSQDEIDLFAMTITVATWGISSWTPYLVVGVNMSLAVHCFQLPMALRSCLYPMLHDYTWGWMGDCVDALAIVSTVAGVTTSLGFGAIQIVSGFIFLGWVNENSTTTHIAAIQTATIWVITVISTATVLSGLYGGVRVLSSVALPMSSLIMLLVFVFDDSKFILNLIVQEFGHYLQNNIFLVNFWTDAFGQLHEGSGRAVDGKSASPTWMDEWMVFYLAWWITWSAFFGCYLASISKGRKIWELCVYCLFAPTGYCLVWFCTMGGVGLRQSRQALELQQVGAVYFNNSRHFLSPRSDFCYDVPQENVLINNELVFTNHLPGVTPVCLFNPDDSEAAAFNVLNSFRFPDTFGGDGLGSTMSLLFILASAMYCVTSCDSACLVVDNLASSGRRHQHWARRMFWSITIGALATALLSSGGAIALRAVQAASILCGLPFTLTLCVMMQSILLLCRAADEQPTSRSDRYIFPNQPEFTMPIYGGVYNALEYVASFGKANPARVDLGIHRPTKRQTIEFAKGVFIPFVSLWQIVSETYPQNPATNVAVVLFYTLCHLGCLVCLNMYRTHPELAGLGWTMFFASSFTLSMVRSGFRAKYNLRSNGLADLIGSLLFEPQVLAQMRVYRYDENDAAAAAAAARSLPKPTVKEGDGDNNDRPISSNSSPPINH